MCWQHDVNQAFAIAFLITRLHQHGADSSRPRKEKTMRNRTNTQPPLLAPGDVVVLFDGTCKLCNGWAQFIITHDRAHLIKLATVQSLEGQKLLAWAGLPTDNFNTIVIIHADEFFIRSEAMFEITARLPAPWSWLQMTRIVPGRMRDWMYDKIAVNRYKMFGRYDCVQLPAADHKHRFLNASHRIV